MSKLIEFNTKSEFESFIITNSGLPFEEALSSSNNGVWGSVVLIKDTNEIYANNKLQLQSSGGGNGNNGGGNGNIDLSNIATKDELNAGLDTKQDIITDLDTIRSGASKGATALQSYTEQYKGTVTGIKINGATKNPSNGVVNLGTVITSHQDISGKQDKLVSGTNIKTINGSSILGSGNITISGGSSSGGSGAYAEVNHGTGDTTFTLTPNTFHVWDEVASLTLTLGAETSGVANEYLFQFSSGETTTSLTLPDDIKWVNDAPPVIEPNMLYQVSILKKLASVLEFSNASSLVENKVTLSISGTKYLISLQYAAASNIVVKVRTTDGPISVSISSGEMSNSASPVGPMLDDSAYIELITPNVDTNYNYIW